MVDPASTAPTPAATIAICSSSASCSPRMFQYPRRNPCVRPVDIDAMAPAPGDRLITHPAPKNANQTCHDTGEKCTPGPGVRLRWVGQEPPEAEPMQLPGGSTSEQNAAGFTGR